MTWPAGIRKNPSGDIWLSDKGAIGAPCEVCGAPAFARVVWYSWAQQLHYWCKACYVARLPLNPDHQPD